MSENHGRKLERIILQFDDGREVAASMQEIRRMNEIGEHLEEISRAISTAKWLAALRTEP